MAIADLLRQQWIAFRRPSRLIALAGAGLAIIALGLLYAFGNRRSCRGPCPVAPVAADGSVVSDRFWFVHRDFGPESSITTRLTALTGTITYPPPNHDQIVPGLVPWAKAGIIFKDGLRPGSRYAAVMLTGNHGVRFQWGYRHDVAESTLAKTPPVPRWLRLTRSADTVTSAASIDGSRWHTIGTVILDGLPDTVQGGLFVTSPGDLSLRKTGLGGAIEEVRFTQAVGTFDNIAVEGGVTASWASDPIGEMNRTDWERQHNASGAVERPGGFTISGTGDIGPISADGPVSVAKVLLGLPVALLIVLVLAARYGVSAGRELTGRGAILAAAAVIGAATFVTGLVAIGITIPTSVAVLKRNGLPVDALSALTAARVIVGVATVLALCAAFAYGVGAWLRRGWAGVLVSLSMVAVPYTVATLPLLTDTASNWLLRLTPAAAFAVMQTAVEYPQVTYHYAPSAGYFPLPGCAGVVLLCAYTFIALRLAYGRAG